MFLNFDEEQFRQEQEDLIQIFEEQQAEKLELKCENVVDKLKISLVGGNEHADINLSHNRLRNCVQL